MKYLLITSQLILVVSFVLVLFDVITNKYIIGALFLIAAVLMLVILLTHKKRHRKQ